MTPPPPPPQSRPSVLPGLDPMASSVFRGCGWVLPPPPPTPFFHDGSAPFFTMGRPPPRESRLNLGPPRRGLGGWEGEAGEGQRWAHVRPFLPSFHPSAATGRPPPMHARSYYLSPGLHIPIFPHLPSLTDTMLTDTMLTPTMLTYPPSQAHTTTPPRPTATTPSPTAPRRGCTTSRGWGRS